MCDIIHGTFLVARPTPSRLKRDVITKTDDKTKSRFVHWHHYHSLVDYYFTTVQLRDKRTKIYS